MNSNILPRGNQTAHDQKIEKEDEDIKSKMKTIKRKSKVSLELLNFATTCQRRRITKESGLYEISKMLRGQKKLQLTNIHINSMFN